MTVEERRGTVEAELATLVRTLGLDTARDPRRCRAILSDRCAAPDRDCRLQIAAVTAASEALGPALVDPQLATATTVSAAGRRPSTVELAEFDWATNCWRRVLGLDEVRAPAETSRRAVLAAVAGVVLIGGGTAAAVVIGGSDDDPDPAAANAGSATSSGRSSTTGSVGSTSSVPGSSVTTATTVPATRTVTFPPSIEGDVTVTRVWTVTATHLAVRADVVSTSGAAVSVLHDEVVPASSGVDPTKVQFDPPPKKAVGSPISARYLVEAAGTTPVTLRYELDATTADRSDAGLRALVDQWRSQWRQADVLVRRQVGDPAFS